MKTKPIGRGKRKQQILIYWLQNTWELVNWETGSSLLEGSIKSPTLPNDLADSFVKGKGKKHWWEFWI